MAISSAARSPRTQHNLLTTPTATLGKSQRTRRPAEPQRGLLTIEQFAEALGLSPKTIRQRVWRRQVPFVRIGRSIRFRPETVDEIVNRGSVPAEEG